MMLDARLHPSPADAPPAVPVHADADFLSRELTPRAQEVWNSMLGLTLEPSDTGLPQGSPGHQRWSGCIALSGEWRGAVTVSCMEPLARLAAGAMFGMTAEDATNAEIQDAIGELANILGGQTKHVLADKCVLGLPVVIEGDDFEATVPHSRKVVTLRFLCDGHPAEVTVVGADTNPSARPHLPEN